MSTTLQLLISGLIIVPLIAAATAAVAVEMFVCEPLRRDIARYRFGMIQAEDRLARLGQELKILRRENLIRSAPSAALPLDIAEALVDTADNDRWSRKAPDAPVISLPRPRVQTGRPV